MEYNWEQLDDNIADLVFANLSSKDIARARLTCKRWASIVKSTLRNIDIRGSNVKRSFHSAFPNLRTVSVVGDVKDSTLFNLSKSSKLEHIELYDKSSGSRLSRKAVASLAALPMLCSLDVYSCSCFTDTHIDVFGPMMSINMFSIRDTNIEKLPYTLYYFRASVAMDVIGISAMHRMKYLQWLDLGYSTDTVRGWLEPISKLRLRVLCVNDCDTSDIASVSGMTTLEYLDMSETNVTSEDVRSLATLTGLKRLEMSSCTCRFVTQAQLSDSLSKLRNLEYLNIYDARTIPHYEHLLPMGAKPSGFIVTKSNCNLMVLVAGERDFVLEDLSRLPPSIQRLEIRGAKVRSNTVGYFLRTLPNLTCMDVRFIENICIKDLFKVSPRLKTFVTNKKILQRFIEDKYPGLNFEPVPNDDTTGMPHDLVF